MTHLPFFIGALIALVLRTALEVPKCVGFVLGRVTSGDSACLTVLLFARPVLILPVKRYGTAQDGVVRTHPS